MESANNEDLTRVILPTYRPGAIYERGLLEVSADGFRHHGVARTATPLWIVIGAGVAFAVIFALGIASISRSGRMFHFGLFLFPVAGLAYYLGSQSVKEFHAMADTLTHRLVSKATPITDAEGKSSWQLSWPDVQGFLLGQASVSVTDGAGKKNTFFLYGKHPDTDDLAEKIESFSGVKGGRISPAPALALWAMYAGWLSLCPFAGFVLSPVAILLARKAREKPAQNYWMARLGYVLALVGIAVAIGFAGWFAYDQWSSAQFAKEMENW